VELIDRLITDIVTLQRGLSWTTV